MNLLERERYLADLTGWLDAASKRNGCVVLIGGEAGIGKTSLLHEFTRMLRDVRVLWGACDDLFTPRPLAPLHDIAHQLKGELLATIESGANRAEIFTAALAQLERAPTLAVLEDMHWADEATLDMLKFLGRRIEGTRSMIAASYRDDEVGLRHPLRVVFGDLPRACTHRMLLEPLTEPAVRQLARSAGRRPDRLFEITAGNPLFLTELLATSSEQIPATVRDAVLARAARLAPEARKVAELVSIVPVKTESWLLESVHPEYPSVVEDCLRIGMVLFDDGALGYRHELVRRILEGTLLPPRRQQLNAAVLAALSARSDVPAPRLAHHADGARSAEAVLRYAPMAAAEAASVGAHREAASYYQLALHYGAGLPPAEHAGLLEHLAYECYLISQHERAIEARSAALEIWRALGSRLKEGDTLRWLSRLQWFAGRRNDAERLAVQAVATLESLPASAELAMSYANRAQLDMEAHEIDSSIAWARKTCALAETQGFSDIVCDALNTRGTARLTAGDIGGFDDLQRSLQLALEGNFPWLIARAYTNLSAMAVSRRQYSRACDYLDQGLKYCQQYDLDSWWLYMMGYSARLKFEQGDWSGASADAETVLKHPRTTPVTRIPTLRVLGHLRIRRGDPDVAGPLAEARALCGPMPELQRLGTLAAAEAEAAWLAGDREGVMRAVEPAYRLLKNRRDPRMQGELALWLFRIDALDEPPADMAEPYALEIRGEWRQAANLWKQLGCPYEYASLLGLHGKEAEQREALEIFRGLGAGPAEKKLRQAMHARGIRKVPRGSRASTRSNAFGLTRREAEILDLMRAGLRNAAIAKRLFLSTRTVEHHVSAILAKLSVSTRADAVDLTLRTPEMFGPEG